MFDSLGLWLRVSKSLVYGWHCGIYKLWVGLFMGVLSCTVAVWDLQVVGWVFYECPFLWVAVSRGVGSMLTLLRKSLSVSFSWVMA